jgi:CHAT domain-containing protein
VDGADLFLLNPQGIILGPDAQLDTRGSVYLSTAASLRMLDDDPGGQLTFTDDVRLAFADPHSFGFLDAPASLVVDGTTLSFDGRRGLSMSGGHLTLSDAEISANGGVELVAVAGGEHVPGSLSKPPGAGGIDLVDTVIRTETTGNKPAGDILLAAGGQIRIDGGAITTSTISSAKAGDINLTASVIEIENGAFLSSASGPATIGGGGGGSGGGSGGGGDGSGGGGDGSGSGGGGDGSGSGGGGDGSGSGGGGGSGSGGSGDGSGSGGGGDGSSDPTEATGAGGNVTLIASDRITTRMNVNIGANSNAAGDAGTVLLQAPVVELLEGTRVASAASADGNAGRIEIAAKDRLELSGTNNPSDPQRDRGTRITASSAFTASGDAGSIDIQAGTLILDDGARISSSTSGVGDGGFIHIQASEGVHLSGTRGDGSPSSIRAATEVEEDEASGSLADRTGRAGEILIVAPRLTMTDGTEIRSTTALPGSGGLIELDVAEIELDNALIKAGSVGEGSGDAGDILIGVRTSGEAVRYPLISLLLNESSIETSANDAGGGDITVRGSGSLRMTASGIDASDTASDGGNVDVQSDRDILVLEESRLLARAAVAGGDGGVITITTDAYVQSPDSIVIAENEVIVNSPETNLEAAVTELPEDFQESASLFAEICSARSGSDRTSTFVVDQIPHLPTIATEALIITPPGLGTDFKPIVADLWNGDFRNALERPAPTEQPAISNTLRAIAHTALGNSADATGAFELAMREANGSDERSAVILNRANAAILAGDSEAASELLSTIGQADRSWSDLYYHLFSARSATSPELAREHQSRAAAKLDDQLSLSRARASLYHSRTGLSLARLEQDDSGLHDVLSKLTKVEKFAASIGDARLRAESLAVLAEVYALDGQYDTALALIRSAIEADSGASGQRYRWQGYQGHLLTRLGDYEGAIAAYRSAVTGFEQARPIAKPRYGASRVEFRSIYTDLVEALLNASDRQPHYLSDARLIIEGFKHSELENYFQDQCFAALEAETVALENVDDRTAVVYPIVLPDRLELLVSVDHSLERHTVSVPEADLAALTITLRRHLENRTTNEYLPAAQALHELLVAPYSDRISEAGVNTLVFVPDGLLNTIPMSVLHDGERFLIEQFAIAVTPGLSLIAPRPLGERQDSALLVGISQAVGPTFDNLPNVPQELASVQSLVGGEVLLDEDFIGEDFRAKFVADQPAIVHVASHAVFQEASTSYLMTHDARFTIDELHRLVSESQFREPLELLTLSACETAAGDAQAALGLSGSAIRAGARSAMGTLWTVYDESSRALIVDFYSNVTVSGVTKAEALRQAQLEMRKDPRFSHPFYWAPYLMISNWL